MPLRHIATPLTECRREPSQPFHNLHRTCQGSSLLFNYILSIYDSCLLRCEESSPVAGPVQICLYKGIALGKAYVRSTSLEYIISSQSHKTHQYYLYQRLRMCVTHKINGLEYASNSMQQLSVSQCASSLKLNQSLKHIPSSRVHYG